MLDKIFHEVFEGCDDLEIQAKGDEFLTTACRLYGVENMAYLGVNLPVRNVRNYYVHNTYARDWAMRYESENYVSIDPIVRRGLNSLLPLDWSRFEVTTPRERNFFGEAHEYGVGDQGISFPVHGTLGETAVFSVSASFKAKEWKEFRTLHLKDMRIIAEFFHQRVLNSLKNPASKGEDLSLTQRELECLYWSAEGKTYEDIASILKITPRTVRFFLENARNKLGSLNTTHAVVTAMSRGLI
jgi:DNA-binding CsgD family transcriptional regulator